MTTSDREPQYLGTHRGVSRVQIGWTTLYFTGEAYTHAIGNLYGTHEQPAREDIAAARKAIPVRPRPPTLAHAPGEEHKPQGKTPKPDLSAKKVPVSASATTPQAPSRPSAKPKPSAKKPRPASSTKPTAQAQEITKEPISTMADLKRKLEGPGTGTKTKPVSTIAEIEARI